MTVGEGAVGRPAPLGVLGSSGTLAAASSVLRTCGKKEHSVNYRYLMKSNEITSITVTKSLKKTRVIKVMQVVMKTMNY